MHRVFSQLLVLWYFTEAVQRLYYGCLEIHEENCQSRRRKTRNTEKECDLHIKGNGRNIEKGAKKARALVRLRANPTAAPSDAARVAPSATTANALSAAVAPHAISSHSSSSSGARHRGIAANGRERHSAKNKHRPCRHWRKDSSAHVRSVPGNHTKCVHRHAQGTPQLTTRYHN